MFFFLLFFFQGIIANKTEQTEESSELVILNLEVTDIGVYQCLASYKGEELAVIKRQIVSIATGIKYFRHAVQIFENSPIWNASV